MSILDSNPQTGFNPSRTPSRFPLSRRKKEEPCACPICNGLECLCRPRFFAGQLLTDEDLNRLDSYIRAKDRLHNRYLHGWGTVCGLEVLCHRCPDKVTVTGGYALSPCGEDIIVCADETVDFCDLVKECLGDRRTDPCDPPRRRGQDDCEDLTEDWLLSICYDEKATRGITPLRGATQPPCCSRCNCGGSPDCGCACHEKMNGKSGVTTTNDRSFKPSPPQCEPTVICETYQFNACRLPDFERDDDDNDLGPLIERIVDCWAELAEILDPLLAEQSNESRQVRFERCCRAKKALERFFSTHPTTFCDWLDRLDAIHCPNVESETFDAELDVAGVQAILLILEYLIYCFCSAWIPECPPDVCDCRVPLAVVTIDPKTCRVIRICNLTRHRQFVRTAPNMKYWFSPLQVGRIVRELLEQICCDLPEQLRVTVRIPVDDTPPTNIPGTPPGTAPPAQPATPDTPASLAQPASAANIPLSIDASSLGSTRALRDVGDVLISALTADGAGLDLKSFYRSLAGTRDAEGKSLGAVDDLSLLPHWFLARAVGAPFVDAALPDKLASSRNLASAVIKGGVLEGGGFQEILGKLVVRPRESAAADPKEVTALRTELTDVRRELTELRARIDG